LDPVAKQHGTTDAEVRFRMKLHAFEGSRSMPKPHELTVVVPRGGLHFTSERFHRERIVPREGRRRRQPCEETARVVAYRDHPTVNRPPCPHDLRAEGLSDALVAETHPKYWGSTIPKDRL